VESEGENPNLILDENYINSYYKPIKEQNPKLEETQYNMKNKSIPKLEASLSTSLLLPHALPNRNPETIRMLTNNSSLGLTSISGKRRINEDGLRMLQNNLSLKETEMKANILENRLKRLEAEELKAQKNREKAEKKAEMMMNAR